MQQLIGVDQPDYRPALSPMVFDDGASIDLGDYIQPKVEAEVALMPGPGRHYVCTVWLRWRRSRATRRITHVSRRRFGASVAAAAGVGVRW